MALMRPVFNVPELSYWATTAGNTLHPDSTSGDPIPIVKGTGWVADLRPPAKVMNWVHNLSYLWNIKTVSAAASNWTTNTAIGGSPGLTAIIYSSYRGIWCTIERGTTSTWKSYDGHVWTSAAALANTAARCAIGRDATRIIVGELNGDLEYSNSADLSSWTAVSAATVGGGSSPIIGICSKTPTSDFLIIVREDNTVRIASSGVTGSWAAPTTPPGTLTTNYKDLFYIGGSTWVLLAGDQGAAANAYISTDDGDVWSTLSLDYTQWAAGRSGGPRRMAYSEESGRLIIAGNETAVGTLGEPRFTYSDDLGSTWTRATLPSHWGTSSWGPTAIHACGTNTWVVATFNTFSTPDVKEPAILISSDDGATWTEANMDELTTDSEATLFASDGQKVVSVGAGGRTMTSLSIG